MAYRDEEMKGSNGRKREVRGGWRALEVDEGRAGGGAGGWMVG